MTIIQDPILYHQVYGEGLPAWALDLFNKYKPMLHEIIHKGFQEVDNKLKKSKLPQPLKKIGSDLINQGENKLYDFSGFRRKKSVDKNKNGGLERRFQNMMMGNGMRII